MASLFRFPACAAAVILIAGPEPITAQEVDRFHVNLSGPIPTRLAYPVGETLHYRLDRQALSYRLDGSRAGETRSLAYFTRTRLPDHPELGIQEAFTWDWFEHGQSLTEEPADTRRFEPGEGFSLVYRVSDADALEKLDFSSLPGTMDGFNFMIMTWDVFSFDSMVRPTRYYPFPAAARLGEVITEKRDPHTFEFEFPPVITESRFSWDGRSRKAGILGVGIVGEEPCAIVEFTSGGGYPLEMKLHQGSMVMRVAGFEHLWGKTFLSLRDARITRGELVVHHSTVITLPGAAGSGDVKLLESSSIGTIRLELLAPEEYRRQLSTRTTGNTDSTAMPDRDGSVPSPSG